MDQDEQTIGSGDVASVSEVLGEPTAPEGDDKPGRVLQTFLVRVTLRANEDGTEGEVPTNERLADVIKHAIYEQVADFAFDSIRATAEKV